MQLHPKSGRSLRPVSSSDTESAVNRGVNRFAMIPLDRASRATRGEIGAARVEEIRSRIRNGYYHSAAAMDELARRMLSSGAL